MEPEDLMVEWLPYTMGIVRRWAHRRGFDDTWSVMDDLRADGLVALWQCAETYDPTIGTFRGYLSTRVPQRLIDGIRAREHKYHQVPVEPGIDDPGYDRVEFEQLIADLSPRAQRVARRLIEGESRARIGRQEHLTGKTIRAIINGPLRNLFD